MWGGQNCGPGRCTVRAVWFWTKLTGVFFAFWLLWHSQDGCYFCWYISGSLGCTDRQFTWCIGYFTCHYLDQSDPGSDPGQSVMAVQLVLQVTTSFSSNCFEWTDKLSTIHCVFKWYIFQINFAYIYTSLFLCSCPIWTELELVCVVFKTCGKTRNLLPLLVRVFTTLHSAPLFFSSSASNYTRLSPFPLFHLIPCSLKTHQLGCSGGREVCVRSLGRGAPFRVRTNEERNLQRGFGSGPCVWKSLDGGIVPSSRSL